MIILEETRDIIGNRINHTWFLHYSNTANNIQLHTWVV